MWIGDDANINFGIARCSFNFTCKIDWNSFCYKGSFVRLANVIFILLIPCLTVYITKEGKWIEESTIVQCGGAKAQDGKMRWIIITKTTMGVIINLQNSHLLTWSLPTEEIFQLNGQNRPMANLPVVNFRSQPLPLNTQLSVLFAYLFSSPSRKVWTSLSLRGTAFLMFLAAIIRESSDKLPCIENREGFAVHSSTWPSGAKGEWRVNSWLAISNTHEKNIVFFHSCVMLRLFSGLEIFV